MNYEQEICYQLFPVVGQAGGMGPQGRKDKRTPCSGIVLRDEKSGYAQIGQVVDILDFVLPSAAY